MTNYSNDWTGDDDWGKKRGGAKRKSRASTPSRVTIMSFFILLCFNARRVSSSSSGLSSTKRIVVLSIEKASPVKIPIQLPQSCLPLGLAAIR